MAVLLIMRWLPAGSGGYVDTDVIQTLDANEDPRPILRENNPVRFGFLYVTDRNVEDADIQQLMVGAYDAPDAMGERQQVAKRLWQGNRNTLPGNDVRFEVYQPYATASSNVKFRRAQLNGFFRSKNTQGQGPRPR